MSENETDQRQNQQQGQQQTQQSGQEVEQPPEQQPTRRVHHRAVMPGKELFEADASDLALDDSTAEVMADQGTAADDLEEEDGVHNDEDPEEDPLLAELPPHWGIFNRHD